MKRLKNPTIVHLTLLGFFIVLLPLVLANVRSFQTLDRMASQHKNDMSNIVLLTESARAIHGNLEDLERSARQYQLLGDDAFLKRFNERHASIVSALKGIRSIEKAESLNSIIRLILSELQALKVQVNREDSKSDAYKEALVKFERLFYLMRTLNHEGSLFLNGRVKDAEVSVDSVSRELILYIVTLAPLTLALVFWVAYLILKPLREIDLIIRKLGRGDYEQEIKLAGPTDLKRIALRLNWLRKRLADSEAEKQRFLRHISHELKTPLSTIKEGTELLEDEVPGSLNHDQREVVKILSKAVTSFQGLINNLLDFNLLKGNPSIQAELCGVKDLVNESLNSHQLTAHRKNLRVRLQGDDISLRVDRSVLRAALDNLVSNAVHYTPSDGFVDIKWQVENKRDFKFHVSDSGPGIPENERHKVFLPFYQGTARKHGPLKGTGLGLSVAKECVESHGGRLQIADSNIGAHFTLSIPGAIVLKGDT